LLLSWLWGLLALAAAIVVATRFTELEHFAGLARAAQPLGLLAAFALQALTYVCAAAAATIGPMPLGLGTFEAVCVAVLHLQSLSMEAALTATLVLRGFTFWLPMAPGLILARRELSHRVAIGRPTRPEATANDRRPA
jgi:hypothetical protein